MAIFLSAILLILSIGLASIGQVHFGDMTVYYSEAASVFKGHAPYGVTKIEYPPGVLPFILLPYLLMKLMHSYYIAYLMLTWFTVGIFLWHRLSVDKSKGRWWVFLLPLIPLLQFVFMQLDVFSALLLYFCLYCFKKQKFFVSAFFLAAATIIKAYPAVCLLPLIWMVPSKLRVKYVALFAGSLAVMLAPVLILEPKGFLYAITYQTNRPIEIMASASIVGYVLKMFFSEAHFVVSHKSYGVVFAHEKIVETFTTICLSLGLLGLSYAKKLGRLKTAPALLSIIALLIYILFYNVGSPQFWVCVIFLLPLTYDEIGRKDINRLTFVVGLACLATWLQFLFKFLEWLALCLMSLRILLLVWAILLCIRVARRDLKLTKKLGYNNAHG